MDQHISIQESFPEPSRVREFNVLSERERRFFVGDHYLPLDSSHSERIKLLSREDAQRVWDWLPLKHRLFSGSRESSFNDIEYKRVEWNEDEDVEVRDWLWRRGIPFAREVFILHDDRRTVIQTDWKMLVRYWDAFSWDVGVQAIVVDRTVSWCCILHHENSLIFEKFT